MLETKIRKYITYLGDSEYMAEVVTSPGAVDTLIKLLQSNDDKIIGDTCLFITDFVLSCSRNDTCKQSWERELKPAVIPKLEHLVLADNHFICKQVIYTLGKICSYDSVPVMLNAFHQLRDQDPILLPRLIGELFWLGVDNGWDVIDSMVASNQYTTRWATMTALDEFVYDSQKEDETFLMRKKFCNHLRHDAHPLVREEAEYNYNFLELQRRKHHEKMSKHEYKKQKNYFSNLEDFLQFKSIATHFSNYMYAHNLPTYTIKELKLFIDNQYKK
ncbi:HEAT repeat domain-containing protein [Trichocoleus sp. FACHB-69]|nr:HEAT repeat domain-containing protein [Trichocoleus sp. FACHB-69]